MDTDALIKAEHLRVLNLFGSKHKPGFPNKLALADWYVREFAAQNFCCFYCGTSILDIQLLIAAGQLKTRKTGYGYRGQVLEIDKKINDLSYSPQNCVLSCYYCNNDKSYTHDSATYKRYFGPNRKAFFDYLLKSVSDN